MLHTNGWAVFGFFALTSVGLAATVIDPSLSVSTAASGLEFPTGFVFTAPGEMLVTEKASGKVQIVRNGAVVGTAIDLPVANDSERGLLSIALHPNFANNHYVYTYRTTAAGNVDGGAAVNNTIERYVYENNTLTFNKTIRNLATQTGPNHSGGKIAFGPDGKLYAVIGDLNRDSRTQNNADSAEARRTGVVLRMNKGGMVSTDNPFYSPSNTGTNDALNDIYAYGIRNSFGLNFDPVSHKLWDTENGPGRMDEINLVSPGFNSGWKDIMGPVARNDVGKEGLVTLGSNARYIEPKFSWLVPVAPTDLQFVDSDVLGTGLQNDLFVADANTGSLYHFDLAGDRKTLDLTGDLADRVQDNVAGNVLQGSESILFGSEFGLVSDLEMGPDGLYVTDLRNGLIYRIELTAQSAQTARAASSLFAYDSVPLASASAVPEPAVMTLVFGTVMLLMKRTRHAK